MPRKAIPFTEAQALFPDFRPGWLEHNAECSDPPNVAIGSPRFGTIRHVVVIGTDADGTPTKPLWDQVVMEEGPKDRDFPGVIIVPYCLIGSQLYVILRPRHRPVRGTNALEFPQGGIEAGETSVQCAKRELEEETGLRAVNVVELPSVCAEPDWFPRGTKIVAAAISSAQVEEHTDSYRVCSVSNLAFSTLIDTATSLAALVRFLAWNQAKQPITHY